MNKTHYIINNRFIVNAGLNYVRDLQNAKESRLEPRLMEVLSFLTARVNQLVTREELVKEIWNDYGGGDEALNQAISFLRKLLDDNNKTIIETIPKKGYILHAAITEKNIPIIIQGKKKLYWVVGLLCLLLIAVYFIYSGTSAKNPENSDSKVNDKTNNSADIPRDSSIEKNLDKFENKSNIPAPPGADVFIDTSIWTHKSNAKKIISDSASGSDVPK